MTVHDPWADEPAPKPATTVAQERPAAEVPTEAVDEVVVTLKAGTSFSDPWIVLHAKNVQAALNHLSDNNLKDLMDRVKRAGKYFVGEKELEPAKGVGLSASEPAKTVGQRLAQGPPAPSGEGRYCAHGEMLYKEGFSAKTQKAWKGYFCPAPRGSDQCEPQFVR